MTRDINISGATLRIWQTTTHNNKPTIIFLHDSLGCIELWRDFPEALGAATNCNILVYDRQGYGKSTPFAYADRESDYLEIEADVLNVLMEACNISNAILFGHSDGGSISLIAAAKYPDRIKGVITEGAHIFVEEITLANIRAAVETYRTTNLKDRLQKYHGEKTEDVFRAWAGTWLKDEYRSWNIEHFLTDINCPVLIIQGENDEYGSLKQVDGIIEQVSGTADKLIIPAIGHSPHKEARQVVLSHSAAFITRLT